MQEVTPPWLRSGVVLVCDKCSRTRIPEESPEIAARLGDFDLRAWLKSELKAHGAWGPIRVVSASCLDICAKGRVTVVIAPAGGAAPETFVVDPLDERQAVYDAIVARLGSDT